MKFLIDGIILLDVLQKREPHYEDSSKIWKMCETDMAEGYVSALTFADMVYVMRKELTPEMIQEVLNVIAELAKDGMTMLIVTHEMNFARRVADRVIFMDSGMILEENSPDAFFDNPQNERAKIFLNSIRDH